MSVMMSYEDMQAQSMGALRELYSHVVGLFTRDLWTKRFTYVSSGFLVEYQKEFYIATAGHNLDEEPMGLTVWLTNQADVLEGAELREATGENPDIRSLVDEKAGLDLGLIKLEHTLPFKKAGKRFYQIPDEQHLSQKPIQKDALLFVVGYPGEYVSVKDIERTPGGIWLPSPVSMQTVTTMPIPCFGDVPEQSEVGFHLHVECKSPTGEESLSYAGCSGGPVFILSDLSGLKGDPRGFSLIGIEYFQSLHRHHAVLRCNFIKQWCRFCRGEFL